MSDLAIIGGGVIGLSIAYEMSRRGASVRVLDMPHPRARASWAGGGILLPTNAGTAIHPLEHLRALSSRLHTQWALALRESTGIDNGYRECGAIYFARSSGEIASLTGQMHEWTENRIRHSWIDFDKLNQMVPGLSSQYSDPQQTRAASLPDEWLIRNPHHLQALRVACQQRNVEITDDILGLNVVAASATISSVRIRSSAGEAEIVADNFLLAAGAWSGKVVEPLGIRLPMVPVRGQMLLFKLDEQKFEPLLYEGTNYVIPRDDGHVLVGSTTEEAGFDSSNTTIEVERLKKFASGVIPDLNEARFVKCWAGLRPATNDSFPYLGRLDPFDNFFVASGHFKWGLHLSTGTALVMSDLIEGKPESISLEPFAPARMNVAS